ncbi:hypothetical protein TVAG_216220 [Trichomonas vaginalis G3]|uniref:Uncharacterized protein n=1 Tax=Trichomonas vaginalis (strain ATCC PRA-98 / G3) TaxID=412133 RepID=A2ENV6_TRIV3|nr:spectrin binding [Trichomonas vaginalis G3]EAY05646.1 hypothetical protein TVAG_216220 [Trichomonas vaginalis G3]KAI5553886.1 spectrin binding [Trichomonas vaginalis G3]|eukprot:XP_001317869.1 hypothetical protein [Trichomonas vaginalis G3]
MKFNIFDGIIYILNQKDKELRDSTEEIKKFQRELHSIQNQCQNAAKQTTTNQMNESRNQSGEFLTKIAELKESDSFENVYKFLDVLSLEGNREIIKKACKEGLWKKTTSDDRNVLHFASQKGNLRLVMYLIEFNWDKEVKSKHDCTPLMFASKYSHFEVVKYLILCLG